VRILITGANGILGRALRERLTGGDTLYLWGREEADITDEAATRAASRGLVFDTVIHAAAYTNVDGAESEPARAMSVNRDGTRNVAALARERGAVFVYVSSDYVFDGTKGAPYVEEDPPHPLGVYGATKLAGEEAALDSGAPCLVVRTSWLFGTHGPNFVEAIRNQIAKGTNPLRVVSDQQGRPTYTPHLADAIIRLALLATESADARGIVHYADGPACSWFDFAQAIVEETGSDVTVKPVTTDEFPRPAKRPAYSVLSTVRYERLTGAAPASWRDGLRDYLAH
jgi:dTDP-4-dehydrorhamnose reductase